MAGLEETVRQVHETMALTLRIQARLAEIPKGCGEWHAEHASSLRESDERMARVATTLAEIGQKLKRLRRGS